MSSGTTGGIGRGGAAGKSGPLLPPPVELVLVAVALTARQGFIGRAIGRGLKAAAAADGASRLHP